MKGFLSKLHRWLGFPLGLLFLVTFTTGFLTAIDELASRKQYSGYHYRKTGLDEDALALASITRNHQGIRQIIMPTESTPYYQAVLRGERYTYAIDDLRRPVHEKEEEGGFFKTVLQLHRNYLLGKEGLWGIEGKYYAASVALLALLISLVGFWLWWPLRKTFRLRKILPAGGGRKQLYQSHMTGGVVMLAAIALLSLTGASMTYRSIAQWIFGVERERQTLSEPVKPDDGWHAWLSAAHAALPDSELTGIRFARPPRNTAGREDGKQDGLSRADGNRAKDSLSDERQNAFPADGAQILEFRFLAPGDWLGLPNSNVLIDREASALVGVNAFKDLPLGEKLYLMLKPLHTGKGLHGGYILLQLALSFLGIVMVLSGVTGFVVKKCNWRWRPQRDRLLRCLSLIRFSRES